MKKLKYRIYEVISTEWLTSLSTSIKLKYFVIKRISHYSIDAPGKLLKVSVAYWAPIVVSVPQKALNIIKLQYNAQLQYDQWYLHTDKPRYFLGVKPVIQPIRAKDIYKSSPFKEKSSFHFVVLWQILNGME